MLQTAAAYERAFLSTSVPSSTATTLRSAPSGDPAASSGPATAASTRSTLDPPPTGMACCPNSVRRKGMSSTNVAPSITDATSVATLLATKRNV